MILVKPRVLFPVNYLGEGVVELAVVGGVMGAAVAIGAEGGDPARIVGTAIGEATDVMRFEVGAALGGEEGGRTATAFTDAIGTLEDVYANGRAAVANVLSTLDGCGGFSGGGEGALAKVGEGLIPKFVFGLRLGGWGGKGFFGGEFEDDHIAKLLVEIGGLTKLVAGADHLTDVTDPATLDVLKEVDILAVLGVVADGAVAAQEGHVADLSFTGVEEDAVRVPAIPVAILLALFAGEEQEEGVSGGGADATLGLAAELGVEVTADVDLAGDEHG